MNISQKNVWSLLLFILSLLPESEKKVGQVSTVANATLKIVKSILNEMDEFHATLKTLEQSTQETPYMPEGPHKEPAGPIVNNGKNGPQNGLNNSYYQ